MAHHRTPSGPTQPRQRIQLIAQQSASDEAGAFELLNLERTDKAEAECAMAARRLAQHKVALHLSQSSLPECNNVP